MSAPTPEAVLDEAASTMRDVSAGLKQAGAMMKRATAELDARARRIERLRNALAGLVGLVQLIESRSRSYPRDTLAEVMPDMLTNHRYIEACQVLGLEDQL